MTKGTDKRPAVLRKLQDRLIEIEKDELYQLSQISLLARELRKKRRLIKDLDESLSKDKESYESMSKAKVLALKEYWDLRLQIRANTELFKRTNKELKDLDLQSKIVVNILEKVRKQKRDIEKQVASWNQIVKFKSVGNK